MSIEEVTEWASIFNAYATGRTIQTWEEEKYWTDIDDIDINIINKGLGRVRIKPKIIARRMTNQQFADWLRDCPEEHREYKFCTRNYAYSSYCYPCSQANEECPDVLIRRNHGEWEEPIIVVEE